MFYGFPHIATLFSSFFFFFHAPSTTEIYTFPYTTLFRSRVSPQAHRGTDYNLPPLLQAGLGSIQHTSWRSRRAPAEDRKSTRLNSSHMSISYAVFCLKKKKKKKIT